MGNNMYLNNAKYVNRSVLLLPSPCRAIFLHFVLEEYVGYKVYISKIGFLQLIILTGTVNASPASVSHFLDSKRNAFQTGVFFIFEICFKKCQKQKQNNKVARAPLSSRGSPEASGLGRPLAEGPLL